MRLLLLVGCLLVVIRTLRAECMADFREEILRDFDETYEIIEKRFGKQYLEEIDFVKQSYEEHPNLKLKPDFIIVGAGSAGCALANRLTENKRWTVLLLDAGGSPDFKQDIPSLVQYWEGANTGIDWGITYEVQKGFGLATESGRLPVFSSRVVGGTSTSDNMFYGRTNLCSFKKLSELFDTTEFSQENILKYFKKLEKSSVRFEDKEYRGYSGPVTVEDVKAKSVGSGVFVDASQKVGYDYIDYNGRKQVGVSLLQARTKRGLRMSMEKAYLRPIRHRKNLHIWTNCFVTKILFEGDDPIRATGVRIRHSGRTFDLIASKEVLITAGAYKSAQLLMLSGIGPRNELDKVGIKVVKILPVGKVLGNPLKYLGLFISTNTTLTRCDKDFDAAEMVNLVEKGTGSLTSLSGHEAVLFAQSPESKKLGPQHPDIKIDFAQSYLNSATKALLTQSAYNISESFFKSYQPLIGRNISAVIPYLLVPSTYGCLTLNSADPYAHPRLVGNFLSNEKDVKILIWAVRLIQMIVSSKTYKKYDARLVHIRIPTCSFAKYDSFDYWKCAFRHITFPISTPVGTCKMGLESDETAVVSFNGLVHGVENLRVVGSGIMPFYITGDKTVMDAVLAERIADVIKQENDSEEDTATVCTYCEKSH